jgi:hypothetical protein
MKNLLFTLTISLMTLSAANAAPFTQADDADNMDGFVTYSEAVSVMPTLPESTFLNADSNGDGKLTPSEFKNLKF